MHPTKPFATTCIACLGDANDPQAWSSIPYHILHEGRRQGVIHRGVRLQLSSPLVRWKRWLWNTKHVLSGHKPGGFQYSPAFLNRLWEKEIDDVRHTNLISNFQLLPPIVVADTTIRRWFYLDGTLTQLRDYYGARMDARWFADVWKRERHGYHSAVGVIAMSSFCADSLIGDYAVPRDRVHVVPPGANLTADAYTAFNAALCGMHESHIDEVSPPSGHPRRALRLVFVGRSIQRKGLDRLLRALALGRSRGLQMTLRVIGVSEQQVPHSLRNVTGVEWLGFISRRTDTDRFLRAVAECDIGCLLSRAEMAGISIRESLSMGQPVIGPATGGAPDLMPAEASWLVAPHDSDEKICSLLLRIEGDVADFARKRATAWRVRQKMLWEPAIRRISEIISAD